MFPISSENSSSEHCYIKKSKISLRLQKSKVKSQKHIKVVIAVQKDKRQNNNYKSIKNFYISS